MFMAESTILDDIETGELDRQCRYFKAKVLNNHKADSTDDTFQNAVDEDQTIVFTKKSTSLFRISSLDLIFKFLYLIFP